MAASTCAAFSQSRATTSRAGDLQIGGGFTSANSDYLPNRIDGFALYGDFDFASHLGVEVNFHQASDGTSKVYERTYEVGGRYVRHYGRLAPYAKVLVGRSTFNYPYNSNNLTYNMLALGGGLDFSVRPQINVRADIEYQRWSGFKPGTLTPVFLTIGVAYHFPGGRLSIR